MSEQIAPTLDWRELAPDAAIHDCDCHHCDLQGDLEPIDWPMLVVADGLPGAEYVTDRFMMIRADLAPIPEGYEGPVMPDRPKAADLLGSLENMSDQQPIGRHFRWTTIKALELTGWDLRLIEGSDKRVAVVDRDGNPIGVTIASKLERDDVWDKDFTRPYEPPATRSAPTTAAGDDGEGVGADE